MLQKPIIFLIMLLTFVGSISFAQEIEKEEPLTIEEEKIDTDVFVIVEQMPEFPGGQDSLYKFLGANIVYPNKAKKDGVEGKVYINFTIEKDGSINEVKVLRGVHPLLDEEAVRVVESFPKWKPGKQKGKTVRVSYNLPLNFVLNTKNKERKKK
ncbi:MAG: energy transducer TonB [Vicingaceae bacterium]|jgi:protein TonB|nr:energy transducer TonB [Flavobacteriales bacterium]MDF1675050.1 energy transducer TonB [Vicingaceae bacterium]|tara:strand:+ start:43 stop:504 length:462 start_codon:yes stop_codon:yes gene_type:complete